MFVRTMAGGSLFVRTMAGGRSRSCERWRGGKGEGARLAEGAECLAHDGAEERGGARKERDEQLGEHGHRVLLLLRRAARFSPVELHEAI